MPDVSETVRSQDIAITGISGRFPGAAGYRQFWENLKRGVESIARFTADELEIPTARAQLAQPNYVAARAILEGIDQFDHGFFGIYPQEANVMDPQHRVFLECCWEAIEDAGYDVSSLAGAAGVFAGCSPNSYFLTEVCRNREYALDYAASYQVGHYTTMLGTIADTLATRVAYKLNLRGPAVTILSACSTSLVAICQACTNLLTYQCDVALAGGVSITLPQKRGYLYQAGGMVSPDGHCRAFDAAAQGTVFGSGAGVVVLKRLAEALADRDHIYAVIKGFATNNDGGGKVGFTAPSVEGQAQVITTAQAVAGIDADTVSYVEAHGTATPLGDPIEVAALTQAFRAQTGRKQFCALGTAKTNVGHLDVAAGVTGLIKTALSLEHRQLPPTLHFQSPNPKLKLEASPFFVNAELRPWAAPAGSPLRAGVSAFGVGGTNAHVVLEEAPKAEASRSARPSELLLLSARSETALAEAALRLADHLEQNPELPLGDVSFTLIRGRKTFEHRRAVVCRDTRDAVARLRAQSRGRKTGNDEASRPVFFLFPGQGSQQLGMAQQLYQTEQVFRRCFDTCAEIVRPYLGSDLRDVVYAPDSEEARVRLNETRFAQPALFATEYALAQLWRAWGVAPAAMLGHSVGEFVAGCLAGVFTLEEGLRLVAERARIMQDVPRGAMLSVHLDEREVLPLLNGHLSLAALNAPSRAVISGPFEQITALEKLLADRGVAARRLAASHAFHSSMMDGVLGEFGQLVRGVRLHAPSVPYVSCTTGDWIRNEEATDPEYWTRHLRETVRFSSALEKLRTSPDALLLEVGPGVTLQTLARQHRAGTGAAQPILSSVEDRKGNSAVASVLSALGTLWTEGVQIKWDEYFAYQNPGRLPLPTYPFERSRCWIDPPQSSGTAESLAPSNLPGETPVPETRNEDRSVMAAPEEPRRAQALARLVRLFEDLSGMKGSDLTPTASFLELGFDSLFLTQVSQSLHSEFGVKIAFRELLDELSSLDLLAARLESILPPSALRPEIAVLPAPAKSEPAAGAAMAGLQSGPGPAPMAENSAAPAGIQQIMKDQLDAMSQLMRNQLELLRGNASGAPAAVSAMPDSRTPVNGSLPVQNALPAATAEAQHKSDSPAASRPAPTEFKPFGPYKPVQKEAADSLNPVQRAYLDALILRYTSKTRQSRELTQRYRRVLADPRVASGFRSQWKDLVYPITTNRSRGSRLWDVDGNEYIDLLNGFGPIALGHLPSFVLEAAREQLEKGIEIGPQTPLAGEVAELLCEMTGMERATFCNTGSEAVMAAMRLARTVTGRNKVVFFSGDYHGNFDEVLVRRFGTPGNHRSAPIAPGIPAESVQNIVVLDYGSPEAIRYIREHAAELAAVLVEPVQSRHPALQPRDFLRELRQITADSGVALIFDEIVTGFRVHMGGAQAYFGIQADLATYGKVLGGGFPIGAIAGSARFMDALDGGSWEYGDNSVPSVGVTFFAGTFVRHPLALAAAKAVLLHLKSAGPALQEALAARTSQLVARLNELFQSYSVPSSVEACGSIFYFSFPSAFRFGSLLYYHLRERGIHIQEGFPCFLTTAHSDADLESVVQAFEASMAEMQSGGVLPDQPAHDLRARHSAVPSLPQAAEARLTEPQLEILLSAKLSREANCSYNEGFTLELKGELDQPALEASLRTLLERHDALRSTFDLEQRSIRFLPQVSVPLEMVDLSASADPHRELAGLIDAEAGVAFDLEQGPLLRIKLARLAQRQHVLLVTSHHLVCDGWSTNVLVEELGALYSAAKRNQKAELPAAGSFCEYAAQVQAEAHSAGAEATERYWLSQFAELPPLLNLPLDRPRPGMKSFAGGTVRRILDLKTTHLLKRTGAAQGCTLFVTLLAGFETLLSRLAGQNDLVVGIPAAAQSLLEGRTLVGHCVNFLPLRARIDPATPFADILKRTRTNLLDAYEHQNYTFGTLVRKLGIPRDASRLPLIEVQFNLDRMAAPAGFEGLSVDLDACPKKFVNFDLFLNAVETKAGLVLDCDYNTDLLNETTVLRWLKSYECLLRSAARNIQEAAGALALLDSQETSALVSGFNQTESAYPSESCIHQLFGEQALRTPSSIAVQDKQGSLTYAELDRRASQLARVLQEHGVGRDRLVALLLERSAEMVIAMLAVLKAGGAYIPLDPAYPSDRIRFILDEARPQVILTEQNLARGLAGEELSRSRIVCLDAEQDMIMRGDSTRVMAEPPRPSDLAYVIYTSGSTGKPKGVEIPHRAVVNFLCSMQREPGISASDRLLAVTTLSFDIAGLELLLPLVSGATVVVASRETTVDGALLAEMLEKAQITILQATPATWRLLLEAGWKPTPRLKMLCGGEALPRSLADQMAAEGAELWNMYGPTETTIWSAVSRIEAEPGPVLIGLPIANTRFYVVAADQQLAPVGVPGELYIGGDGVARGYHQRPDLTAQKFVPDPFGGSEAGPVYKTGDLVRRHPDGRLEFMGRLDNQVKVRGFRIELGEIEAVLAAYPGVREAAVIDWEPQPGDTRLLAYLAMEESAMRPASVWREHLGQKLPSYMIPSQFIRCEALPRTPNQKLDRRALPKPAPAQSVAARKQTAPLNETEAALAAICGEVLGRNAVCVEEDLFNLGADSLQIFQIAARAVRAGLPLTAATLMHSRTVRVTAQRISADGGVKPGPSGLSAIKAVPRSKRLASQFATE